MRKNIVSNNLTGRHLVIASILFITVLYCATMFSACATPGEPADLAIMGGRIITLDGATPEATALAIRGDRIIAVGSRADVGPHITANTNVIQLNGELVIPGFIESHAHFMGLGKSLTKLRLGSTANYDEIIEKVAAAVAQSEPGQWITGRGWHQEKWDKVPTPNVDGLPFHQALSDVSPDNPVLLRHASGHASLANAIAMELAGMTADTPDPDGGEIIRDASGNPIGVFRERAQSLISQVQLASEEGRSDVQIATDRRRYAELAVQECLSKGITSFCDAGSTLDQVEFYKELVNENALGLRLWVMLGERNDELPEDMSSVKVVGMGDNRLTVRAIKRYIDGALGSHGAWLLAPYDDLPESQGLNIETIDYLEESARLAVENGFQLCTHAIGDRGNREILDIYERMFKAHPDKKDLRWRIEHAQHLNPDDIPRFGSLGVIAAMQGVHATSDGPWVPKRIGDERSAEGAYVWQELMKTGATICNGTDAPVEDVAPLASFHSLVTRQLSDGSIFYPEQRMSRIEALRASTINGAYAAFEENIKGSLSVGKLADITILSKNILTIPAEEILSTEVISTIVGGKLSYNQ